MKCQRKETLQIDKPKENNTEQIIHWSKYNKKHDCRATRVPLTENSISIQEIDWWSKPLERSFWTQKGLRLNVTRTHAEKLLNQRQTLFNELLYWNVSKIRSFFLANADYAEIGERTIPFLQEITGGIHLMVRSLSQVQSTFSVSGLFNRLSKQIRIQKNKIN